MKQNWTYKKLGELCSFIKDGDWIESKDQSESGIRLIQTGNIGNGVYKDKEERSKFISESTFSSLGCTEIFEGDCLVSRLPEPIGRCCLLPKLDNRCITAVDCSILRFTEEMLPKYFVYYSQSCYYAIDIENKTTGTTRKRISRKNLEGISIPLPPLSTQQSIIAELDEINNLLSLKRKELETYDKLAQSLFYEMFGDPVDNEKGWEVKKLGDISAKIANGYNAKLEEDTYKTEGIMYFRCQNVWRNYFDYSDLVYIDEETNKKMKSSSLKHNDLLITKIGRINTENSSLGRVSLYEGEDDRANLSGNLCFIRLNNGINHKYILYILISNQFRSYIRRTTVGGIDKRALNVKQISSFPIPLPPLPLQQTFATRIEAIEVQKANVKAAIEKLETLLAARMQYWFE